MSILNMNPSAYGLVDCPRCHGTGSILDDGGEQVCPCCHGEGLVFADRAEECRRQAAAGDKAGSAREGQGEG